MPQKNTSDQLRKKLIEAYLKLNPDEQLIMQILCVPCRAIREKQLTEILKHLNWKDSQGKLLVNLLKKSLIAKFKRQDFINVIRSEIKCHDDFKEIPVRELVLNGKYQKVKDSVEKILRKDFLWFQSSDSASEYCQLRHALYSGNHRDVLDIIGASKSSWKLRYNPNVEDLIKLCLHPVDPHWLQWLPKIVLYHTLGSVINYNSIFLKHDPIALEQAHQYFPSMSKSSRAPLHTLAEAHILRGELQEAERLLENDNTGQGLAIKAALNFLYGYHAAAYDDFAVALKA
ncbi:MAG: hypothetical protein LC631_07285, partial [Desulfovibrionales bacterium]|nr:hypothetical protein [Desulfovibrionales bacterium]